MWRAARASEDEKIIEMSLALYREDPSPKPVPKEHTIRTLKKLRGEPRLGLALVLDIGGQAEGYALLVSFWSNELGGEICIVDEFYVNPAHRGQGYGESLLQALKQSEFVRPEVVAIDLEVTPSNERAREFYSRVGFSPAKNLHMRLRFDDGNTP